ncbi:putative oxidoreductase [Mycobacterium kansasii]|uniref:Putative oxidoreductase n=1 Tax=Mycobacterium kansasii TaxID=1768 RepID=A0A1V3WTI5_MYCKA|nr:putative oxidoreductase [Mycobacterium kansasii]
MAKRYLDWPGGLTVFDVRAEAMEPFVEGGATAAASVAEVAGADIISVTVLDDTQVRNVITGNDGLAVNAKPGTIIAIHSTISDSTAVELAKELEPRGIYVVDAPVSGGPGRLPRANWPPWWAPTTRPSGGSRSLSGGGHRW